MQALAANDPALVMLEDIEAGGNRPQQSGGVSFGIITGALEAYVIALQLPHRKVSPKVWKGVLKIKAGKTDAEKSAAARLAASQTFPGFSHLWPLVKHDGRAEAALLAYYGATYILGAKT